MFKRYVLNKSFFVIKTFVFIWRHGYVNEDKLFLNEQKTIIRFNNFLQTKGHFPWTDLNNVTITVLYQKYNFLNNINIHLCFVNILIDLVKEKRTILWRRVFLVVYTSLEDKRVQWRDRKNVVHPWWVDQNSFCESK